ncbi:MAG: hypothetical protein HFK10_05480 [Clostridia bacterium]|nr:hypothetical protein [Clostridia bacterium]
MKIRQTAGRDALGGFAPQFAQLNDDVLFGEVWSSDGLSAKTRSMLTVAALVSKERPIAAMRPRRADTIRRKRF